MLNNDASESTYDADQVLQATEFKISIDGLHSDQISDVTVASDAGGSYDDSLTDTDTGAESSQFAILNDEQDEPLTSADQRRLYPTRTWMLTPFPIREIQVTTPGGDRLTKSAKLTPSITTLESFINTSNTVDPKTKFALGFLFRRDIALSVGNYGSNFHGANRPLRLVTPTLPWRREYNGLKTRSASGRRADPEWL